MGWPICVSLLAATAGDAPAAVLADAATVWRLLPDEPLTVHGDVRLGVALTGDALAASTARGGDGLAAEFAGGWLALDGAPPSPPTAEFTLLLRLRDPDGRWAAPLVGSWGGDAAVSLLLRGVDGAELPQRDQNYTGAWQSTPAAWMFGWPEGPRAITGSRAVLEALWGSGDLPLTPARRHMLPKTGEPSPLADDARDAVLRVMTPLQAADPGGWHDVILRGNGAKLQLYLDGVLVDEEFCIGPTRAATAPWCFGAARAADGRLESGFHGQMDHAALWHRALSEAEMVALCGGAAAVADRDLAILGPQSGSMQYFRSRGHSSKPGDCIPFYSDGVFHLFYLVLRRNMHSKWDGGHGGLEILHASTTDLVHWRHHAPVAPITEPWEAWNGTGGVVRHQGRFFMFYPTPDYDGDRGGIQLVTSDDGETWTKHPQHPFLPGGDCEVFADPDPSVTRFHLLRAGRSLAGSLPALGDKTLVAWVSPETLDQRGAGVLTVEGPRGVFDSIVLGEVRPRTWMAGSDHLRRTQPDQSAVPAESAEGGTWIRVAAVYSGRTVSLFRDDVKLTSYEIAAPLALPAGWRVLVGLRHFDVGHQPSAHFRGAVADARVYPRALTAAELGALRPHQPSDPAPLVWFDFAAGAADRAGGLAGELEGGAALVDGALRLDGGHLSAGGSRQELEHLVSSDLMTWTPVPEPFITTAAELVPQMCPNWFAWRRWYYLIGGTGGIWRSRQPFGPWTMQHPRRLDNLSVPKTGAFGERRLFAGFLGDDGWGGNLVVRELTQAADGTLGTRFVPEMVPAAGDLIALPDGGPLRLDATKARAEREYHGLPRDYRLSLTMAPQGRPTSFGVRVRGGCELRLSPVERTAGWSAATHSGSGGSFLGGPRIDGVSGLELPVRLEIVCVGDLVDVEIDGRHTLINRYWNPGADRLAVWVEGGAVEVRDLVARTLR